MKILFACIPIPGNRFVEDLKTGLEAHAEVVWDYKEFWTCNSHYDVVHIHWPEYLSYELESYLGNTDPIPDALWQKTIDCLEYWNKHALIVYTRHVQYPHRRHDAEFLKLYRVTTSYCDVVVHFAHYSIQQFKEFYPEHTNVQHVVIPHHNYASLPNNSTREEARKQLKIDANATVMLVFGAINENEKPLIREAFEYIPSKNKVLLAPGWKIQRRIIGYIRLREWVWRFEKWLASLNLHKRVNLGFIKEEDAHLYLNAADFLFIPRTTELNSGNITLGCTFGLVVVGKKGADIGEILEETGNPTFEVGNGNSIRAAVEKAICLKNQEYGDKNRLISENKWSLQSIVDSYCQIFKLMCPKC